MGLRTSRRAVLTGLAALLLFVPAAVSAPPLAWQDRIEVAVGGGERGPWRQNDSRYDFVDDPTVAIDDRGDVAVAWVDQARKDVLVQRVAADGTKRGQPIDVSRSPATFSWLPRIVLVPRDPKKIRVLWQEIIFSGGSHGGDIVFARSDDGGTTFSEPLNLSSSVAGDGKGRITKDVWHNGSLDLAADSGDTVYAVWTEYEGALWLSRSPDGGRRFSRPRRIAGDDARPARAPSLALGADRTVYLAWTIGEDDAADVRVARSTDGGATFGKPRIVARTKGYSDAPKLAVDPGGALHLVYGEDHRVWYTRSTDGARTFAPPREISGPAAGFPSLSIDAKGSVYVLWELFRDHPYRPRGLGFVVSRDGGRAFTPAAAVPDSADPAGGWNGSSQGLLMKKLAVNARGALAIVNSSLRDRERSRVWLIRTGGRP
ncbi:MAG: exo-alpha-sialidase [Candidatus Rokubacteria bacterium]|nr:exo-alpha-sialidase [Candidatus Rokubacteria bacterium]